MRHKLRKLAGNKKYKRFLVAVTGAAVLSSTLLTGLPAAKAHGIDLKTKHYPAVKSEDYVELHQVNDPVQVVKDNAAAFGFNPEIDHFSLLSRSKDKAIVQVRTPEQTFKIDLIRHENSWEIKTIRGIGDMNHPATYTPAGMFFYRPPSVVTVSDITQTIIYQNDNFSDWYWNKTFYPYDMSFGIVLQKTDVDQSNRLLPDTVKSQIDNIDFGSKFVLYANLGTVAAKGYGIGIEKIVQTGNDFIITVRTNSPRTANILVTSKLNDVVSLDRSLLNFEDPITFTFIDQNGNVLAAHTLTKR